MKHIKIISFLVLFALISCSEKNHFKQFDEFQEDNHWENTVSKTYEFSINDDTKKYNLVFLISHVYGFQFNSIPIQFQIEKPDGTTETLNEDVVFKKSDGTDLGSCAGDICDLEYVFKENTTLQKGNYKIVVINKFNAPYLPNIIGVGLKVEQLK